MAVDSKVIFDQGWLFRYTRSTSTGRHRLLLMLHGWTGNEDSMNVFQRNLPDDFFMVAPRGNIALAEGGYGWLSGIAGKEASLAAFREPVDALAKMLPYWLHLQPDSLSQISLMGFSQGTAMAYTLAIQYPQRVSRIAGLSGFLPAGADAYLKPGAFSQKQVFIAHGSQDETIPVQWARDTAQELKQAGAQVTYCEEGTGHKLSLTCFTALRTFFQ
jgi:phospholipase/carboxylesterase